MPYFNYQIHAIDPAAASYWQRRAFLNAWWSLYQDDSRWTPPDFHRLRRELNPRRGASAHLARLDATLISVDALHRTGVQRSRTDQQEIPLISVLERTLAAAVAVIDPRRGGATAHLAMAHFGNDRGAFDHLYHHLVETLAERDRHRLVGPVGLSPHLGAGLLVDGWDEWPPLHTAANPPYAPELVEDRFRPLQDGRLYRATVPLRSPAALSGPAAVRPFDPARLAGDLLPLLVAATENPAAGFPPPDAAEAAFLWRQLAPLAPAGYVAEIDGAPVGFVLLGADAAGWSRATNGGRSVWRRGLFAARTLLSSKERVGYGQIYFGAVLPEWRRQGIGAQLWRHALDVAGERGWESLTVGPVWRAKGGASPAEAFLEQRADATRQWYRLYERSF